ncbi:MAG: hypothetical protein BTN85_0551 [Candidatus Methanohalarchaeum thermophilum]|uniref:Uncharacterized protein n=1 Tax=Methanohalarchaeum thermophilum TaxID=1903181 RepID=A0A1Q6DUN3_METT1|nr:MAG: hypothetical protein BTN85_0271 [Candidatus Methanohalarchaeum thermophilum]OKY78066.1 MAG: hypothetical protein BTN85_0551 [Candidatus Methanohalarchaeum thermophilum]
MDIIYIERQAQGKVYLSVVFEKRCVQGREAESTKEFDYWVRIPVCGVWGGFWVPIKLHEPIKGEYEVEGGKVVWKLYGFWVNIYWLVLM